MAEPDPQQPEPQFWERPTAEELEAFQLSPVSRIGLPQSANPAGLQDGIYVPPPADRFADLEETSFVDETPFVEGPTDTAGASGPDHQWKAFPSGALLVSVLGGDVTTQGGSIVVADLEDAAVVAGTNYAYIQLTRASATREINPATAVTIQVSNTAPTSDATTQSHILAVIEVDADDLLDISQWEFGPLNLYESLMVSNGEFELAPVRITPETYSPPTP